MTNTTHAAPAEQLAPVTMQAALIRTGDHYVTGKGRLVEITEVVRGGGLVRLQLIDGWLFWLAGTDTIRIVR